MLPSLEPIVNVEPFSPISQSSYALRKWKMCSALALETLRIETTNSKENQGVQRFLYRSQHFAKAGQEGKKPWQKLKLQAEVSGSGDQLRSENENEYVNRGPSSRSDPRTDSTWLGMQHRNRKRSSASCTYVRSICPLTHLYR